MNLLVFSRDSDDQPSQLINILCQTDPGISGGGAEQELGALLKLVVSNLTDNISLNLPVSARPIRNPLATAPIASAFRAMRPVTWGAVRARVPTVMATVASRWGTETRTSRHRPKRAAFMLLLGLFLRKKCPHVLSVATTD